jgi:hypothetical protein
MNILRVIRRPETGISLCRGLQKPGLSPGFVMHKGIPIAIVRLRHKICKTICTSS